MFYFFTLFSITFAFPSSKNAKEKHGLFFLVDACSEEYKTLLNV